MGEPVSSHLQGANPGLVADSVIYDAELFGRLRQAVVFTDRDGIVIYWNEGATRLFGWSAEEMLGHSYFERFPDAGSREAARQHFESLRQVGEIHAERQDHRKDGTNVWVDAYVFHKQFRKDRPAGIIFIFEDITERKTAEEALRQSEEQFRSAMENSAIGMALVALDGKWLKANRALCQITGYTEQELLQIDFQTITHPDDLAEDLAQVHRLLKGEIKTYQMEKRYFHKDGHIVWILLNVSLVRNTTSLPQYFISQIQDISQRHRAEEAMRRNAQIFAQLHDCVVCTGFDGRITYWNEAATKAHGWAAWEMQGRPIFDIFPVETRAAVEREFSAFGDRSELSGAFLVCNKDGSRAWMQVRVTPYKDDSGRRCGFIVVARDITERKFADEKLRQSESMMAAAQRIARFGSWELDLTATAPKARPLQWSDECYRIFGYEPGSIQGTNELFFARVPPEEHEAISQAVSRAIAEKGEYSINHRVILPDGEVRHIHEQARVFVDERTGLPLRMIGTAHDVTERVLVMEELVRAKEAAEAGILAKSQFLAVLSHEIRTPLNPILGAAQLLLDQQMVPDQRELLEIIIHAGEHLQTLLNDMLDLAKMESGRAALTMAPCKIADLVRGVFDIKGHEASRKGLKLLEEVSSNLAFCYLLDEARLRQILLNLVGNAVKFTPRGEVAVCAEKLATQGTRDQIRFSVRDTGIGLQPAHTLRIFEPFYQVDSSSTRRYEGAGLGLAICRRLVELMDGQIGVESEYGRGSTFWFTVWLEHGPSASSFGEDMPSPIPLATGERRVLLVEDDDSNRTVLVAMLERAGCSVTEARTANAALELFEPGAFDLVLMDLRMPDLDGSEAARRIRERERAAGAPPTPIVAQTANSSTRDLEIAKDAGMNDFLAKPIRRQRLLEILNRHAPQAVESKESDSSRTKSGRKPPLRNGRK